VGQTLAAWSPILEIMTCCTVGYHVAALNKSTPWGHRDIPIQGLRSHGAEAPQSHGTEKPKRNFEPGGEATQQALP
jgi:hypothetical protein